MKKQRNFLITVVFGGMSALLVVYILAVTGTILKGANDMIFGNTINGVKDNIKNECSKMSISVDRQDILYANKILKINVRNTGTIPITKLTIVSDIEPYSERTVNVTQIRPGIEKTVIITSIQAREKVLVFPQDCTENGEEVIVGNGRS